MRPLIKRSFVVRYRKTDQGSQTVVIDEVEVKPFVLPVRAEDRPAIHRLSASKSSESDRLMVTAFSSGALAEDGTSKSISQEVKPITSAECAIG
jgi:hypothetical protein